MINLKISLDKCNSDLGCSLLGPGDPVAVVVCLALALVSALGPGELLRLPLVLPGLPESEKVCKTDKRAVTLKF